MRPDSLLKWTLFLPLSTALSISSHLSTETNLQCSTIYSSASVLTPSTTTAPLVSTTELSPVILHNYTTSTITITPKPFETLFSVLATKTKTVERQAVNGTLGVEVTKFKTSTFWHHETTTRTVTKERLLTSRTTVWVETPSAFVGVREAVSAKVEQPQTTLGSPDYARREEQPQSSASGSSSSRKASLQKPTKGRFAVSVECQQHIRIHTTETLLLTASEAAKITAKQETRYTNRTIYGTITSTILANSSSSTSAPTRSGSSLASPTTPSSSPHMTSKKQVEQAESTPTSLSTPTPLNDIQTVATNTTTITKTPYTITFTWTSTATATLTQTLHATTTITSFAACATGNLMGQTSGNRRINGVSLPHVGADAGALPEGAAGAGDIRLEERKTQTPGLCCEACMQKQACLWSIWEASGQHLGSCYLSLLVNNKQANSEAQKQARDTTQDKQPSVCRKQEQTGTFGYSGRNGEVRYVVSNGLCGILSEQ